MRSFAEFHRAWQVYRPSSPRSMGLQCAFYVLVPGLQRALAGCSPGYADLAIGVLCAFADCLYYEEKIMRKMPG